MREKIFLKPITPIFIGSGEDYYPQDYFILDDKIHFIDKTKFLEKLKKENKLDEFIKVSEDINELLEFIDDNADEKVSLDVIEGDDWVIKSLLNTISRPLSGFIKDKFLFKPIIPGSSLKGVVRTALLDYCVREYKDEIEKILKKFNLTLKKVNSQTLETIVFCNANTKNNKLQFDPKVDILKALYISDLKPINYTLKAISPKNKPYKKNKLNSIPVIIESLIDGEFEGEIRIDREFIRRDKNLRENRFLSNLSIELIKIALKEFFTKVSEIENNRFKVTQIEYRDFNIKLGKFAGGGSKSINELRKITIKQINKVFDYQLSVWIYEDMPLGWAKLEFKGKK